ncbi:hypothetical protein ACLKA7_014974 [Drosophila subpalustris]
METSRWTRAMPPNHLQRCPRSPQPSLLQNENSCTLRLRSTFSCLDECECGCECGPAGRDDVGIRKGDEGRGSATD